ncbi:hypothetical protein [Spiroplasma clarkii]|uniref:hypothetical protein n=1 Tax=Spiroplasma clarkii TaxID=2139 RepID=UPI001F367752|nr:hypothetical protein [Spiroplasma clarkii]
MITSGFIAVMGMQLLILSSAYGFYHDRPDKLLIITTAFMSGLGSMTSPIYQVLRLIFGFFMCDECTKDFIKSLTLNLVLMLITTMMLQKL